MKVEFPISIGLVGAPGSGKSAIAQEFKEISKDFFEANNNTLALVSNPGAEIEARFDQAMGPYGSYVEDLWAYHHRYEVEQILRKERLSFLSCGTVIDNIAHCAVNGENMLMGIQVPETEERVKRQQVAMSQLTLLMFDRLGYQFAFYAPYKQPVLVPGMDESEARYHARVDRTIQALLAQFNLRIQVLDQPTVEDQAQEIFDTVKRIIENGPDPGSSAAMAAAAEAAEDLPPDLDATLAE